jgi:hypothetical protein
MSVEKDQNIKNAINQVLEKLEIEKSMRFSEALPSHCLVYPYRNEEENIKNIDLICPEDPN